MRLININAFLEREELIAKGTQVDRRTKVLEFCDDEATDYAILSHRWTEQEVNYEEMIDLAKMEAEERDEIRHRDGYRKILDSCELAKRDKYKWLWVDTCCIDKRSSAELSEAINSMYRWYENSSVCYAYLHDFPGSSFPTEQHSQMYPKSNGYPEWFSRGWTLQEMIAPKNVQFFNKNWRHIGDKRTQAETLAGITRVPQHILRDGLPFNRPCVAQIMSWAADRTTTRVEDRAYSLLGLLDVNMPMLYGEGKKAFHRLQLEIIRMSNDQSIFAWHGSNGRSGSILADDPSFFWGRGDVRLMDHDEFIRYYKRFIREEEFPSVEEDRYTTFPITNRGIQIWLLLYPLNDSHSVFEALLPCLDSRGRALTFRLALWKSNYYRYWMYSEASEPLIERSLQFRQLYLRYQDTPHPDITFEIDDNALTEGGLTYCGTYPQEMTGNTLTLTNTNPFCVKVYSDSQADCLFAVGFGQYLGNDWIHFVCDERTTTEKRSWEDYAETEYRKMVDRGPDHAQSMAAVRSRGVRYDRVYIMQTELPRSIWTVRTSCIVWENSRSYGVRIEGFRYLGFSSVAGKWTGFDVGRTNDLNRDMRGLMMRYRWGDYKALVDEVSVGFLPAPNGTKLGDYGRFTDSNDFCCQGNIFADLESLGSEPDITPRQHTICATHITYKDGDYVITPHRSSPSDYPQFYLYKPLGLSLPNNRHFNSLLTSLSTRLANKYLVTRAIQCATYYSWTQSGQFSHHPCEHPRLFCTLPSTSDPTTPLCTIEKPFVWHRGYHV
ncbi:heterokaryon incompatibility protein-domain-containing protein [Scleroderma yunnanense]